MPPANPQSQQANSGRPDRAATGIGMQAELVPQNSKRNKLL